MRSPPASQPPAQTDAESNALHGKHILLLVGGGIAAYKVPDLVRHLQKDGAQLRCVLTRAGREFVTPMTLAALVGEPVHEHLFDPAQETQFGHIRLARAADLVLVAPATANLIAKAAHGLADDLASTILLASRAPLLIAPAMNVAMWEHAATQDNLRQLGARGAHILAPASGDLACGEEGAGRLREPQEIAAAAAAMLAARTSLHGRRAVVTAGPTWEALDPVRYLAARSSGKQGYAIAAALAARGAEVRLISGPTNLPAPAAVERVDVESTRAMRSALLDALPCDIAVMTAAIADWQSARPATQKLKKRANRRPPQFALKENPDILTELCAHAKRPPLVVGFSAETENVLAYAKAKRAAKGCDWMVANDVAPDKGVMGGEHNQFHIVREDGVEHGERQSKAACAAMLAERIARHFAEHAS